MDIISLCAVVFASVALLCIIRRDSQTQTESAGDGYYVNPSNECDSNTPCSDKI
jgi:hypothetical protein